MIGQLMTLASVTAAIFLPPLNQLEPEKFERRLSVKLSVKMLNELEKILPSSAE
jgi:hypothetical protein